MKLEELKAYVVNFYSQKSLADSYKKEADKLGKNIKEEMANLSLNELALDEEGLVCTVTQVERKSFKENELIDYLKGVEKLPENIVKTVEVVDEEALEKAIYDGFINAHELAPFIQKKVIPTLKVKALK